MLFIRDIKGPLGVTAQRRGDVAHRPRNDPHNPMNGHVFYCKCLHCLLFWDSRMGSVVYSLWYRKVKARAKVPSQ